MKKVRNYLKRPDGTPWPYATVMSHVFDRIQAASLAGSGVRLSAEEVRALDWAVIRTEGYLPDGLDQDDFRLQSFTEARAALSEV